MQITTSQLADFAKTVHRTSPGSMIKLEQALNNIGVTVQRTALERMTHRAHQLIHDNRSQDLRAALRLLDRERVNNCTEDEAKRLLEYFGEPDEEF